MEIWVTEWMPNLYCGVRAYRIQQDRSMPIIRQRHEYIMDDGSIEFSDWLTPMQPLADDFLTKQTLARAPSSNNNQGER